MKNEDKFEFGENPPCGFGSTDACDQCGIICPNQETKNEIKQRR